MADLIDNMTGLLRLTLFKNDEQSG